MGVFGTGTTSAHYDLFLLFQDKPLSTTQHSLQLGMSIQLNSSQWNLRKCGVSFLDQVHVILHSPFLFHLLKDDLGRRKWK